MLAGGGGNAREPSVLAQASFCESKETSAVTTSNPFDAEITGGEDELDPLAQASINPFEGPDPFIDVLKEPSVVAKAEESADLLSLSQLQVAPTAGDSKAPSLLELEFDTSKEVQLFEDENSCPICFEIFCSAPPRVVVDCPECRRSFCRGCLERIHKDEVNGSCPFCRQAFEWSDVARNYEKERLVAHFPSNCVNCHAQMARGELPAHEKKCSLIPDRSVVRVTTCARPEVTDNSWACARCTFKNHPDLLECEICHYSVVNTEDAMLVARSPGHIPSQGLEGPVFVSVQTKVLFRKWKPMYYSVKPDAFELYSCDTSPRSSAESYSNPKPAQRIPLHTYMNFGPIYTISDAKVKAKNVNAKKKIVRRTSHHKRLFKTKLFEYTQDRSPHPEYAPVLEIAMNDVNQLKQLLRRLSATFARATGAR